METNLTSQPSTNQHKQLENTSKYTKIKEHDW